MPEKNLTFRCGHVDREEAPLLGSVGVKVFEVLVFLPTALKFC